MLAAANALSGDSELIAGTQLRVPEVGVSKNDASTFKPYNPNEIVGSTSPGLPYIPPPGSNNCASFAPILTSVILMIAMPYLMPIIQSTGSILGGALAVGGATFVANAAATAIGSAMGFNTFSWRASLKEGIVAGLTAGLGNFDILSKLGPIGGLIKSSQFATIATQAVLNKGIDIAASKMTGVEHAPFSWKDIAIQTVTQAVIAPAVGKLTNKAFSKIADPFAREFVTKLTTNMVTNAAGVAVSRAFGTKAQFNFGAVVGNAFASAMTPDLTALMQDSTSNSANSDWRKEAELRLRQVAAEEEIERQGYAETIYLDGNSITSGHINQSAEGTLTASERKRLAEVAVYHNVHLNPQTGREQTYRNVVMSFRIPEESKLLPSPLPSSLPAYLPLASGYAARSARIEASRQSAVSYWSHSRNTGVAFAGRAFSNAGYNFISSANSLGSILTDPAHAENVFTSLSYAVRNPDKVYDGLVSITSDMFDRTWQENLESASVLGIETLATAGTGLIVRRGDDALGLVDEIVADSGVWKLKPFERGRVIEQSLGQNLPGNFPVIDKFENGLVTSIKSLDLDAATYQSESALKRTLAGYIDKVADFNGRTWAGASIRSSDISDRALDLAIPNSGTITQQMVIKQAIEYGSSRGVTVNIIIFP